MQQLTVNGKTYRFAQLPAEPTVLIALLDLCNRPDVPFEQLAALVENDPALTAKVLQLGNSPSYRQWNRLTDLRRMLVVLGIDNVKSILLAGAVQQFFAQVSDSKSHQVRCIWFRALVCANGTDYICNVDPSLPEASLETGSRVLLNEAFAVTDSFGFDKNGPVVCISETFADGRIRVGNDTGISDTIVMRSSLLVKEKLKPGIDVRLDANQRVAIEVIGTAKRTERLLSHVEALPWNAIGGQDEAV